jgi:hypothetical protein
MFFGLDIAFDDAYRALQINDRTDPLTEIIARKIINLAQHGERDPIQLRDKSLQTVNWPSLIDLYRFLFEYMETMKPPQLISSGS